MKKFINRQEFITAIAGGIILTMADNSSKQVSAGHLKPGKDKKTKVSLVKTSDRGSGIKRAIEVLNINPVKGKDLLIKPNFNTADPFPGSTHNDTLTHLILHLRKMGAEGITIGERSGPPHTADVLKKKGIDELCKKLGVGLINFEELPPDDWVRIRPGKGHWKDGFDVAGPVIKSNCIVSTCCLKTHGYGGVFTMSLKLSVGITHKKNMFELHTSFRNMKKMIAEINLAYNPSLILLDGIEAFVDGGPAKGTKKRADVIIAGTDRVAIDAVGLSVLKELGSNKAIMERKIFEQEQIARAVELGLGIKRPEDIEILTDDSSSRIYAEQLIEILMRG